MNIHFLQHVPFEDLGALDKWAATPGNKVTSTRFYEDIRLPFVDLFDVLIVLGGPMSVHDDDRLRWLIAEKELIRKAIAKGKKVIGICLGAQLIAEVMGAPVTLNPVAEIGWFPVTLTKEALQHPAFKGFNATLPAFHWHGETFALPQDSIAIGSTEGCPVQGFLWKNQVLALQFHLEATETSVQNLIQHCPEDLKEGPYVQKADQLVRPDLIKEANALAVQLLENFIQA